jgi:hypothetical protein
MAPYTIADVRGLPKKLHSALGMELPFDGEEFLDVVQDYLVGDVVCHVDAGGAYYRVSGLRAAAFRPTYEAAQRAARESEYIPPSLWQQLCSLLSDSFRS